MQTFTPDGSAYHSTAELPVDLTDYRNAASVRVGIEAALDNAAYAKDVAQFDTNWVEEQGTPGSSMSSLIDDAGPASIVKDGGGGDIELSIPNCLTGDLLLVTCVFTVQAGLSDVGFAIRMTDGAGASDIVGFFVKDSVYMCVAMHGRGTVGADGTVTLSPTIRNLVTPGTTVVYGGLVMTATRWRAP